MQSTELDRRSRRLRFWLLRFWLLYLAVWRQEGSEKMSCRRLLAFTSYTVSEVTHLCSLLWGPGILICDIAPTWKFLCSMHCISIINGDRKSERCIPHRSFTIKWNACKYFQLRCNAWFIHEHRKIIIDAQNCHVQC